MGEPNSICARLFKGAFFFNFERQKSVKKLQFISQVEITMHKILLENYVKVAVIFRFDRSVWMPLRFRRVTFSKISQKPTARRSLSQRVQKRPSERSKKRFMFAKILSQIPRFRNSKQLRKLRAKNGS